MALRDKAARKAWAADYYERNKERIKAGRAEYVLANPEKTRACVKDWKDRNADKVLAQGVRYRRRKGMQAVPKIMGAHVQEWRRQRPILADEHVKAFRALSDAARYRWQYRNDLDFALKERLRRQFRKKSEAVPGLAELIRAGLRSGGASNKVESLLGYSIAQLRSHLERQFKRGMSWEAFGKAGIHIDHILPRKCFDVSTIEGLQAYWSLSNLRPLRAADNLRKGARVDFLV